MNIDAQLASMIELSCSVRVYVPSTAGIDAPIDTTAIVAATQHRLAEWFGGATTFDALGSWVSPTAGLVDERVRIVQAHCTSAQLETHIELVVQHARTMRRELGQDAVAIEVNNRLYLVRD